MAWPSKDPADYRDGREHRSLHGPTRSLMIGLGGAFAGVMLGIFSDATDVPVGVPSFLVFVGGVLLLRRHRRRR